MEQEQKGRPRGGEVMGAVALILALAIALAGTWHRTGTARAVSAGAVLDVGRSESEMLRLSGEVSRTVIPLGRAVGIKMFTDGVMVVGISEIETGSGAVSPASDCGLRRGTSSPTSMTCRWTPSSRCARCSRRSPARP